MRRVLSLRLWLCIALLNGGAFDAKADEPANAERIPTLWVCGDSTASKGRDEGWASHLQKYFDPEKLRVENRARGGRSSRTFQTEGLWDAVLSEARPGDFILIQFGHNDGGPPDRDRARGSLRGVGDESRTVTMPDGREETIHTYGWYLRKCVADARVRGATPIITSPVVRCRWQDGKVIRSTDYPRWAAEVAGSEKCLFVDAASIIADRYDELGEEVVRQYFPEDHTHTSAEGAALNADLIFTGLHSLAGDPFGEFTFAVRPCFGCKN
jgi:rhamnogalacturonan acetylesterase